MSSRPIKYKGPTWNAARKLIKPEFAKAGLLHICELENWAGYEDDCDGMLTFAHSLRRNFIEFKEQMEEVIRACQHHHAILDANKHDVTYEQVRQVIATRVRPVASIYDKKK